MAETKYLIGTRRLADGCWWVQGIGGQWHHEGNACWRAGTFNAHQDVRTELPALSGLNYPVTKYPTPNPMFPMTTTKNPSFGSLQLGAQYYLSDSSTAPAGLIHWDSAAAGNTADMHFYVTDNTEITWIQPSHFDVKIENINLEAPMDTEYWNRWLLEAYEDFNESIDNMLAIGGEECEPANAPVPDDTSDPVVDKYTNRGWEFAMLDPKLTQAIEDGTVTVMVHRDNGDDVPLKVVKTDDGVRLIYED